MFCTLTEISKEYIVEVILWTKLGVWVRGWNSGFHHTSYIAPQNSPALEKA